jgi:hypothetical protein
MRCKEVTHYRPCIPGLSKVRIKDKTDLTLVRYDCNRLV